MTENDLKNFTPTERKILAVLADGERHLRSDFYVPLDMIVEGGKDTALSFHVCNMRDRLRPLGKWIISERAQGKSYYMLVVLTKPIMPIS